MGGTKTLVGCLDNQGVIQEQIKFPTPSKYADFLNELENTVAKLSTHEFFTAVVAVPGRIDRLHGRTLGFGNLTWGQVPIQADVERLVRCPTLIENDGKLGGLSEAMLLKDKYRHVLYITIGTGIGGAVINNEQIDPALKDSEAGSILIEHKDVLKRWEKFASGKAIVEQFGKQASEIHDAKTWKQIAHNLALGIISLTAFVQPEIIVLGGSIGGYFERYSSYLTKELRRYNTPLTPTPPIIQAQRPETAVLYGCYDFAKAQHGSSAR